MVKQRVVTVLTIENDLRPVVQFQGSDSGKMGAEIAVNARALDADESTMIETGPDGI